MNPEQVREFVIAGHGDLDKVKAMLAESPELLNQAHPWRPGDSETAIQAAAHVGNRAIAEFLLEAGAPLEIWTALMLGRAHEVRAMLALDPALAQAISAHGIPMLPHAALSGEVELLELLASQGALGAENLALSLAVAKGHTDVVAWLLGHTRPDLDWKNFQGKTPLEQAMETGNTEIQRLLTQHKG
ncbi:MAG: ankyrin repeat domain-containing protein [Meiothermus sp.]|nr:ankyrin repeat domain-containing protein [Meiothermus sp.]